VGDVQVIVANTNHVKGVGVGHSWWSEQFCAGNSREAVDVLLTSIQNKSIVVDESAQTAKVDAGIVTADFLDYISKYGRGWALGNHPWFTYQTVGGALATGSHGSSLTYGSLSSDDQLFALDVVLANGTFAQISKASHPFLWRAFQVSVGRIGIITAATFKIVPNANMYRWKVDVGVNSFLSNMLALQNGFNRGGEQDPDVQDFDGTQFCWFLTRRENSTAALWHSKVNWAGPAPPPAAAWSLPPVHRPVLGSLTDAQLAAKLAAGAPSLVFRQPIGGATQRGTPLTISDLGVAAPRGFGDATALSMSPLFTNGTFPARQAIIAESLMLYNYQTDGIQYDQYEVSISLSRAHDCFAAVAELAYGPQQRWRGFRAPALIRIVKKESGLLSHTHDGPRIYVNVEDYIKYQSFDAQNQDFQAVWSLLRSPVCQGRMHWGKTGWVGSGFKGAAEYSDTWCDFGCAVSELDPTHKFASLSPIWNWSTNDMGACCIPGQGFDHNKCKCR